MDSLIENLRSLAHQLAETYRDKPGISFSLVRADALRLNACVVVLERWSGNTLRNVEPKESLTDVLQDPSVEACLKGGVLLSDRYEEASALAFSEHVDTLHRRINEALF